MKNADYFTSIKKWVPYDEKMTIQFGDGLQCNRKYYRLEVFAIAGCDAIYGYKRRHNRQYRKYFTRMGIDVSECDMHHGIDGRMYAIPRKIHRAVPHFGFVAYIKRANLVSCWY